MEQMTSYERMMAALRFQPSDRVPVSPLFHYGGAKLLGKTVREYATDAQTLAECSLNVTRTFGFDSVMLGTDVAIEAEALGCPVEQPENAPMHILSSILTENTDLSAVRAPDPEKDGRLPMLLEATRRCKDAVGKEGFVISCANGPINNAGQFFGITELMYLSIDDPEMLEAVLDFSLEVSIRYSVKLMEYGADMILAGEALASPNFISPNMYRTYVLPRQKKWAEAVRKAGGLSLMHVCGNTTAILPDMKDAGFDCIDVDYPVAMSEARRLSGTAVRGNIDPSSVLVQGTPETVDAAVKAVMDDAKGAGLILGTGCDVSVATPVENMYAYAEAARKYGKY